MNGRGERFGAVLEGLAISRGIRHFGVCRFSDALPLIPCRAAARLPEAPKSILVFLFPYYSGSWPERNVSRYAIINDYHKIAGNILSEICLELYKMFSNYAFIPFVDSSPVREVNAARLAGLGDIGLNGQFINNDLGAYVFIGTIVTDLGLQPSSSPGAGCEGCGACVRACPTKALSGPCFKRELCRSHITQKTGELSDWEREQITAGGMAWGCDICLDACPHNRNVPLTDIPGFIKDIEPVLTFGNLERLYPDKPYNYRRKSVLLRNLSLIV